MKYTRWYDKDEDLSAFMKLLEGLNEEIRDEIAHDMIQIILHEMETNKDNEILQLTEMNITEYKRWYDKNLSLHSAIEIIRNFDSNQRKHIISSIMESVVQILTEYNYEKRND